MSWRNCSNSCCRSASFNAYLIQVIYEFEWDDWNLSHIAEHGVSPDQAEFVVNFARPPFPRKIGQGKWLVWGQDPDRLYLQVIYIFDPERIVYVTHARLLTFRERRTLRRNRR